MSCGRLTFNGPFIVHGKKYWFLVCIDNYNSFLVITDEVDHEPKTKEVIAPPEKQKKLPMAIPDHD